MPRILLVVKGLDLGGAERVVTDLATHLAARGTDIEVAVINSQRTALLPVLQASGIAVHTLPGSDHVGLRGLLALRRVVRTGAYDVVHGHGPVPTVLARLLAGHRAVGTIHSMWPALRRPSRWAVAALCRGTHLIAVSATARDAMPRRLRDNTTVIPHGVDLAAVDAAVEAATGAPAHHRDHVELLTVASHRREKNYANLLRAVALADGRGAGIRLRAIGEGPRLAAHRALADQLGIGAIVTFEAPRPGVLGEIAATDVFVLASDSEGQPIVLTEALACGRPVVATTVGRAPELVTADVGILVPTGDPEALAEAISALAADPERRTTMGRAARHMAQRLSLDGDIEAHLSLYREVAV
jgi:glycosyltransferase involved in cell wall biosynthesis